MDSGGSKENVIKGVYIPMQMGNFEGERGGPYCKVERQLAVTFAKTAEPIEMSFGLWTRVGLRKHVLDGVHIGATWRRTCAAAMRPFQITLTTRTIVSRFAKHSALGVTFRAESSDHANVDILSLNAIISRIMGR